MAQLVVSTAVAAATFVGTGGNAFLTQLAFAGTSALFGAYKASRQRIDGPRLTDAQVTSASYGEAIPYVLGSRRVSGQVWWQSERRENATTTSVGKGGGPKQTSYTYERDFLFGLTSNPKGMLTKVWLNGKLVWSILGDAETIDNSQNTDLWSRITFYSGADDQLPDPTYEAAVGTANAPAYRGRSSVFIEGMQLGNSGQLPNLTFEVQEVIDNGVDINYKDLSVNDAVIQRNSGLNDLAETTIAKFNQSVPLGIAAQSFVALANTPSQFEGLAAMTAECWMYRTSTNNDESMLAVRNTSGPQIGWSLRIQNGKLLAQILRAGQFPVTPQHPTINTFPNNQWVHCRLRIDSTGTYLDQDGVTVDSLPSTAMPDIPPTAPLSIGGGGGASVPNGFIDEIRISNIARTGPAPTSRFEPDANTVFLWRCDALPDIQPTTTTVRASVEALCARAGMPGDTYDASALSAIMQPVRSVIIGQPGATRATLEQLQAVYFFESTLSDKLYFRPRATAPVAVLPRDELGAGNDAPQDDAFPITVESDIELPPQVVVRYANVSDDYQVGTEYSDRLISGQVAQTTVDLAIGLEPAEAKAVADKTLMDGLAGLLKSRVTVPMRYSAIEPGDIVQIIDDDARSYRMRVGSKTDSMGLLTWDVIGDDDGALLSQAITDEGYTPPADVTRASSTQIRALDIPLLRDSDDGPGYYVAVKPTGSVWPGCQVFSSTDGVEYTTGATIGDSAVFGTTASALQNFLGGSVMDEVSSVTVSVGLGELSSTTYDHLLADETINAMLIGDEIIRFINATLVSGPGNTYRLTRLLRGQKGTEWAIAGHSIGERAVLLRPQGLRKIAQQQTEIDALRYLKAVTNGQTLSSATELQFTNTGVNQRPLSPANVTANVQTGGRIDVTWARRSRLSAVFLASSGLPIGEASEAYEVEIVNASTDDVVRVVPVVNQSRFVYLTSQQSADGFSSGSSIRFNVYQISATVGRGIPGVTQVTATFVAQPQITDFELLGAFLTGTVITLQIVSATSSQTVTYTTISGDATLAGVATKLALQIGAVSGYSATATGAVVRVTGPNSVPYSIRPQFELVQNGGIQIERVQAASPEVAESVDELYRLGWSPAPFIPYTATDKMSLRIQRVNDVIFEEVVNVGSGFNTPELVALAISSGVNASPAMQVLNIKAFVSDLYPRLIELSIPAELGDTFSVFRISTNPGIINYRAEPDVRAQLAGPARPQISKATVPSVITAGDTYTIVAKLNDPAFYVAIGGDTATTIATELASLIDADADFIATSSGAEITVTHASNNVPFTLSSSVTRGPILFFPVTIQEAI